MEKTLINLTEEEETKLLNRIYVDEKDNPEFSGITLRGYITDAFSENNDGYPEDAQHMVEFSFEDDVTLIVPKVLKRTLQEMYKDRIVYK